MAEAGGGHLDRALPRARHRTDLVPRLDVAGVLRARARSDLQTGLAERGPSRGAAARRELLRPRRSRSPGASLILVRGRDEQSGHSTTSAATGATNSSGTTFRAGGQGTCRQFTCKYHGWRYALDGTLTHVQQEAVLRRRHGRLRAGPVHCDVWNGFIFVNLDDEPRQSLREFLGPMITGLDDYPFDKLTERYDLVAHNNSNWKIFADAFQEYYHVPSLHSAAGARPRCATQRRLHLRALPDRRPAPAGVHCRDAALAARPGVHVPDRAGHPERSGRPRGGHRTSATFPRG